MDNVIMRERTGVGRDVKVCFVGEEDLWTGDPVRSFGWRKQRRTPRWRPPTDVYETESSYVVLVEIAGMKGANISATYENLVLSIHGVRGSKRGLKAYHQMEIAYGEFEVQVRLPSRIESDEIEAVYSDGFLRVIMPKTAKKTISID
jgi:HSP20 family molecular chaperone IbpA